jgi:hypothetical protein
MALTRHPYPPHPARVYYECARCKQTVADRADIGRCATCRNWICGDCGTTSADGREWYCEECAAKRRVLT